MAYLRSINALKERADFIIQKLVQVDAQVKRLNDIASRSPFEEKLLLMYTDTQTRLRDEVDELITVMIHLNNQP